MEFWGCEVPSGQSVDCPVSNGYVHLSHVALGDTKNAVDNEKVIIRVKHRNQDLVLGTFVRGKCDQIVLDLLFHKQFTLSHNSKHSTIYFAGYKTDNLDPEKPATPAVAQNGKLALEASDDDSVDDDDSDGMMLEDDDDDEDFDDDRTRKIYSYADGDDDDDDDEDDDDDDGDDDDDDDDSMDDESDEELVLPTPKSDKKKKRPADSPASVTPPADKKMKASAAKSVAGGASLSKNQKQQQQKEIETTPSSDKKKANKNIKDTKDTPVNTPKTDSKKKGSVTPVSDGKVATKPGQYHCKDCVRNFSNEGALTQHNSAKHKK